MQNIAAENNLAETAFLVPAGKDYGIRWFTPEVEVELCGHATLAAGYVLFHHFGFPGDTLLLHSRYSGILKVMKNGDGFMLDFPADTIGLCEIPEALDKSLKVKPVEVWKGKTDYMLVFSSQREIESCTPDMNLMRQVSARGIIVTAKGKETDFVSRFFAPQSGIQEDPVTGSAHTTLTPYWAKRLNKNTLTARQISHRSGDLVCTYRDTRVEISGKARLYLIGEIQTG
jgi:PhzF family phenazine biosynthesis protein